MKTVEYGNDNGVIFTVCEEKITLDVIRQLRTYLDYKEKELKRSVKL